MKAFLYQTAESYDSGANALIIFEESQEAADLLAEKFIAGIAREDLEKNCVEVRHGTVLRVDSYYGPTIELAVY